MRVFLDTSACAKRYVAERGSEKVSALCETADGLIVSVICLPEMISALSRLVREKRVDRASYGHLKSIIYADLADADICQLTDDVVTAAVLLLEKHELRAMDAIHVASALTVRADVFVSADRRQLAAAGKAGLKTLDVSTNDVEPG